MRLDHFKVANPANHPWAEPVLSQLSLLTGLLLRYEVEEAFNKAPLSGFNVLVGEPEINEVNYLICFKPGDDDVSITDGKVIVGDAILQRLGSLLSLSDNKSVLGKIPFPSLVTETTPAQFELHQLIRKLTEVFKKACLLRGIVLQRVSYPGGRKFAVALTHDVDYMELGWLNRLKFTRSLLMALKNRGLVNTLYEKEFFQVLTPIISNGGRFNLYCLQEIEEKFNAVSALNVCSYQPVKEDSWKHKITNPDYDFEKFPFEAAAAAGFEIGVHGSTAAYNSSARFNHEVDQLRKYAQVSSGRHHTLALSVPNSFHHHVSAGLMCDSSIGFNDSLVFPLKGSLCFQPIDQHLQKPINLIQIPLMLMDSALIKCGYLLQSEILLIANRLANSAATHGMAFSICWHDHLFFKGSYLAEVYHDVLEVMEQAGGWLCKPTELALFHTRLMGAEWKLSDNGQWRPVNTTEQIPSSWADTVRPVTNAIAA